jgi:hypothetical protein
MLHEVSEDFIVRQHLYQNLNPYRAEILFIFLLFCFVFFVFVFKLAAIQAGISDQLL